MVTPAVCALHVVLLALVKSEGALLGNVRYTNHTHARYRFTESDAAMFPEIMLGGLISIHSRAINGECDESYIRRDGIITLEALHFR